MEKNQFKIDKCYIYRYKLKIIWLQKAKMVKVVQYVQEELILMSINMNLLNLTFFNSRKPHHSVFLNKLRMCFYTVSNSTLINDLLLKHGCMLFPYLSYSKVYL